jgi:hypothetical protein
MLADGGRAFGHGRRSISAPARRLAGVSGTLVGTASWTDPTLVRDGHFYPPEGKCAEARLRFYADQFPIVEVDSTYYFPPARRTPCGGSIGRLRTSRSTSRRTPLPTFGGCVKIRNAWVQELAELLIDCEEDRTLRAVRVGMLRRRAEPGPHNEPAV